MKTTYSDLGKLLYYINELFSTFLQERGTEKNDLTQLTITTDLRYVALPANDVKAKLTNRSSRTRLVTLDLQRLIFGLKL